jgi:hypothetical protein
MKVDDYVDRVGSRLTRFGPLALGPLREIRQHLLDSKQALTKEGLADLEAEAEAVRRFGEADEIATGLASVLSRQRDVMERIVKIVSVSNVFTAVWGLAATALLNPTSELLVMTAVVSLVVVAGAVVCMRRKPEPGALVVSGVAVTAVGSAGIMWALMGTRAGHGVEVGLALLMATYCAQGVLAVVAGARRNKLESQLAPG